jgi:small subunit ribosomal protein S3
MERDSKVFRIIIKTARPGMIIGRNGEGANKLREDIYAVLKKNKLETPQNLKIDIEEVKSPESDAAIVAEMVTEGLERRMPFRRVMKQTADKVMANRDVLGVRIAVGGRLGGSEMARKEQLRKGNIPLQTFRADVDFCSHKAHLPYGVIGVKVWIYRGELFETSSGKTEVR